jgi:hypothetical protein
LTIRSRCAIFKGGQGREKREKREMEKERRCKKDLRKTEIAEALIEKRGEERGSIERYLREEKRRE